MGLPFGKDEPWLKTGIGSKVLGGWLVNPVITALSGVPFTVTAGGNLNANGATQTADSRGSVSRHPWKAAPHRRDVRPG
jgi:hypothetical protein